LIKAALYVIDYTIFLGVSRYPPTSTQGQLLGSWEQLHWVNYQVASNIKPKTLT